MFGGIDIFFNFAVSITSNKTAKLFKHLFLTAVAILLPSLLPAQSHSTWENYLERMAETENIDDGSLEQIYEELSDLSENKLDINNCTREQLEQLPFLSAQQAMDLLEYRDKVRRIESTMELNLIESLDRQTITLLKQFIIINPSAPADSIPSLNRILKYGKSTLLADLAIPLYTRKGFGEGYLGSKYKHWLRYTFNYGSHFKLGLTASQDAGEPFFKGNNKYGYDFYSYYLLLRDIRRLKALAVGRYRLRFGMGLILNNGYGFGKLATMSTLMSSTSHIFAHSSRTESNYLQGAAATFKIAKGLDLTAFASYRKIDATLNKDSSSVATILKSGYHRTVSEMNRRRNTAETLIGGNINWMVNGFHAGITGLYASFNRKLQMCNGQKYRQWFPEGYDFYNVSIDYGYLSNRLIISGETAIDKNSQIATVNLLSYELSPRLTLSTLQRYYPYKYQALHANSVNEGGIVNDESGIFLGGKWLPWNGAELSFYTDVAYFAWPKYQTAGSTHRWDNFLQLDASKGCWEFLLRYRMKMKELQSKDDKYLTRKFDNRARVSVIYSHRGLTLNTQVDMSICHQGNKSQGMMASESIKWQLKWLRITGMAGYFNTDDYNSRIYIHEPGLLYTLSFPSFYGRGLRLTLNLRADICQDLTLICKCSSTHYFNRAVISSGLQEIDRSTMTDAEIQVKWKF